MTGTTQTPLPPVADPIEGSGRKVAVAVIATLLLGPFGMFASTRVGAIVMIVVTVLVALPTLGLGVVLTLPICVLWAAIAALRDTPEVARAT